jgi:hypothetical protein
MITKGCVRRSPHSTPLCDEKKIERGKGEKNRSSNGHGSAEERVSLRLEVAQFREEFLGGREITIQNEANALSQYERGAYLHFVGL